MHDSGLEGADSASGSCNVEFSPERGSALRIGAYNNSAFSKEIFGLQLAWDSTSLGLMKECPRKYYYANVEGWAPRTKSVHLTFGLHYHSALERYDHAKAAGKTHREAQLLALDHALNATWDPIKKRPWISDDSNKNRLTLIRSIIWYLEQFADDPLKTVILDNGKPAVKLSFRFEMGLTSQTNESFILCGHFDRLVEWEGDHYILDRKTSKSQINSDFFDKFSPDNQMSTYAFAGKVVYKVPVKGIIIDGAQIAVTFTRFQRGQVHRSEDQLEEWFEGVKWTLFHAQQYAEAQYWPMNEKACGNYGGCAFRSICSRRPAMRQEWLKAGYYLRQWNPLEVRGDI